MEIEVERLLEVDERVASMGVFVYYGVCLGVSVGDSGGWFEELVDALAEKLRRVYGGPEGLTRDPVVQAYRRFFWRIGIDPTKTRPSGEALARRLLRGSRLPRINNVVDVGNIVSAETLVPIGIYDLDRFEPPARITLAKGGEVFKPIGGREIRLQEGAPIMVDAKGVVMHVYPHRDSVETCVTNNTRNVMVVAAGVPGVSDDRVKEAALKVLEFLVKYASCSKKLGPFRRP